MKLSIRAIAVPLSVAVVLVPAAANAENLDEVDSQVYTTTGTHQEIMARAATCVAQLMKPGRPGTPLILSRDDAAGVMVIDNYTSFSARMITWALHTKMTFEAKDGRFRIIHTGIEQTADVMGQMSPHPNWVPVNKGFPNPWKHAQKAVEDTSTRLATCVTSPAKSDNW